MSDAVLAALDAAWEPARRAGVLGPVGIHDLKTHAAGFVPAALRVEGPFRALDAGSGAGVPGILLALEHPESTWVLVDSSERRCRLAAAAVAAVGAESRVEVRHARLEQIGRTHSGRASFDLVVARSFGPPEELAECGIPLLRPGGRLHVSVSDESAAVWESLDLASLGAEVADSWMTTAGRFLGVVSRTTCPDRYPRRAAARRRDPLR